MAMRITNRFDYFIPNHIGIHFVCLQTFGKIKRFKIELLRKAIKPRMDTLLLNLSIYFHAIIIYGGMQRHAKIGGVMRHHPCMEKALPTNGFVLWVLSVIIKGAGKALVVFHDCIGKHAYFFGSLFYGLK